MTVLHRAQAPDMLWFLLFSLCSFLTTFCGVHASSSYEQATVFVSAAGKPTFRSGVMDRKGAAYGYFNNTMLSTGWGVLEVHTGAAEDKWAMFAAGYLEGVLTAKLIKENVDNMRNFWTSRLKPETWTKVKNFLLVQDTWIRHMSTSSSDVIARSAARITNQMDGLTAGVEMALGPSTVSKIDILMLGNTGDIIDLSKAVDKENHNQEQFFRFMDSMTFLERTQYVALSGMCSALVVLTPGFENLLMSHVSWFTYSGTMRIYKHYNFPLMNNPWPSPRMSFSSYAGYLNSLDDFYILDNSMVMLQTTNNVFNASLYTLVSPFSLPAWYRVRAANHLATSGSEWAFVMSKHNSGTYNNQYMVIDMKQIKLKRRAMSGALTIVEQIPGLVESSDQTAILADGHWPSYNVPFHPKIYNISGYPDFVQRYGVQYSYQMAPRAELFRRDASKVRNIDDLKHVMRSNNYKSDPYANQDPTSAICARGDLIKLKPAPSGCYDGKVTDMQMAQRFESEAISGPTTNNGTLPPFSWKQFEKQPHEGLPSTYNFKWQTMIPLL